MPRSGRIRRDPSVSRKQWSRKPEQRVLIVCGALKTETAYFSGLRELLNPHAVDIEVVKHPKSPEAVVVFARDHCDRDDFDSAWCVVDVDHYEREGKRITEAFALADAAEISLAVSNPCFEYWLLLHHDDCGAPFLRCDEVSLRLPKVVGGYDKRRLRFSDFMNGLEDAVKRAKQRDPTGRDHAANPSSGV
ncbi:MAG TPA: RloB family protein [Candidatus Limnocylindrales bacterium]|nr:RloB family protein [Candidatus Limnocylindrales bacterium]